MLEDERMGVLWSIITNLNDPGPLNFPLIKDNDSVSTWAVRLQPVFSISSLLWIWDVSSWWLQLILTQGVKVSGRHIIMIIRVTLVTSHLTERWKLSNNSGPKHSSLPLSLFLFEIFNNIYCRRLSDPSNCLLHFLLASSYRACHCWSSLGKLRDLAWIIRKWSQAQLYHVWDVTERRGLAAMFVSQQGCYVGQIPS